MQDTENTTQTGKGKATASLVLGIASIVLAILSLVSFILGTLAIVFGVSSLKTSGAGKAKAGIITGSIGVVLSILSVVIVFMAVPALQRNSRDAQRRSDVSRVVVDVNDYQSYNSGKLPSVGEISSAIYSGGTSGNLSAGLSLIETLNSSGVPTITEAIYFAGENCEGITGTREFSVSILLESGAEYCQGS